MRHPVRIPLDDFLDDLFLGCAFAAFVDQAILDGSPPDPEKTRQRAYDYYESELTRRNAQKERG